MPRVQIQTGGIWDTIGGIAIMAGLAVQGGSMAIATCAARLASSSEPGQQPALQRLSGCVRV